MGLIGIIKLRGGEKKILGRFMLSTRILDTYPMELHSIIDKILHRQFVIYISLLVIVEAHFAVYSQYGEAAHFGWHCLFACLFICLRCGVMLFVEHTVIQESSYNSAQAHHKQCTR